MKRGEIKQLKIKTKEELKTLLREAKGALFKAKMDLAQNKLKNTRQLRALRDDVARVMTVLRMKEEGGK